MSHDLSRHISRDQWYRIEIPVSKRVTRLRKRHGTKWKSEFTFRAVNRGVNAAGAAISHSDVTVHTVEQRTMTEFVPNESWTHLKMLSLAGQVAKQRELRLREFLNISYWKRSQASEGYILGFHQTLLCESLVSVLEAVCRKRLEIHSKPDNHNQKSVGTRM